MRSRLIRADPNPMISMLIRRGYLGTDTDIQGECHVTTEAEIGVMCLQVKECLGLWAVPRS